MESVKKERKCAAAACVRPTPPSFLTLNPFPARGGQLLSPCERSSKQERERESRLLHTHRTHTRYSEASVTGCHCKLIPSSTKT